MLKETRILVVDDEADIRELVAFHLERAGFTALQAADGEAALSTLWDEAVDLLILDRAPSRHIAYRQNHGR